MLRRLISTIFGSKSRAAASRHRRLLWEQLENRYAPAVGVVGPDQLQIWVDEGDQGTATLNFTIAYSGDCISPFTAFYQTQDHSATTGNNDYAGIGGTLNFSGISGEILFVSVAVTSDIITEGNESMRLVITGVTDPEVQIGGPAIGNITNDDQSVVDVITTWNESSVTENTENHATIMDYTVRLSKPADSAISVFLDVAGDGDHPARVTGPNKDVDFASHEVIIAAGQTTGTFVALSIFGDEAPEYDEGFRVYIEDMITVGLDIVPGSEGTGVILNDDSVESYSPEVMIADATVTEGNSGFSELRFTLTLDTDIEGGVGVFVKTWGTWSADVAVDFVFKEETITLGGSNPLSVDFVVPVIGDTTREAHEKLFAKILDVSSVAFPGQIEPFVYDHVKHDAMGKIMNDDEGPYGAGGGAEVAIYDAINYCATDCHATGDNFADAANYYVLAPSNRLNVSNWNWGPTGALEQLHAWATMYGKISKLYIFDHGGPGIQQVGTDPVGYDDFEILAPFMADGATIVFGGCYVALGLAGDEGGRFGDYVADDAGPGLKVEATDVHMGYWKMNPPDPRIDGRMKPHKPETPDLEEPMLHYDGIEGPFPPLPDPCNC
jgi:Calx-beta domain-containing protein